MLSKQLQDHIVKSKVSSRQLAENSGVSRTTIMRWMRGEQDLTLDKFERLAKACGVSARLIARPWKGK